ncbi:ADP-ribosylglycohydrolase family protein [Chitinophaga sp. S165]|uniref:ADP-ribosylglycohydrolase family protein n=1 Tax=Chitinophaga sp. S165 TaxID=2135462 RepID=UPI000D714F4F|nr:ADP-ribosylglycohydrolase family protein [Chitinophaga sp. S165]PWV49099.1 ADP-ribosylglycohydrolase [Chitinophaga sp. S165]
MSSITSQNNMPVTERFEACILLGAIGDAWGSSYENYVSPIKPNTFYWHPISQPKETWLLTDDTMLTLASCEALLNKDFGPEILSRYFVKYHKQNKLTGVGASTLKAILELEIGGHWSQVGRSGEYAAGNGAAMRIAPIAFRQSITRENIRDLCRITHKNDEAYAGALSVVLAIRAILNGEWRGEPNLLDILIPQLPDTNVRDRFIEINSNYETKTIEEVAKLGTNGYVVNSVPFAVFSASLVMKTGINNMFQQIIEAGGDTDTNASIAGQIAGALVGLKGIPINLYENLQQLSEFSWMEKILHQVRGTIKWDI